MKLFEAIRALVHDTVDEKGRPVAPKAIAADAGIRYGYLLKAADENADEVQFQARWIGPVTRAAKNDVLIKTIAVECGGVFYRLAPAGSIDSGTANVLRQCADYLASVADAQSDRRVTPEEFHRVNANAHDWIAAIIAHVEGLRVAANLPSEPVR